MELGGNELSLFLTAAVMQHLLKCTKYLELLPCASQRDTEFWVCGDGRSGLCSYGIIIQRKWTGHEKTGHKWNWNLFQVQSDARTRYTYDRMTSRPLYYLWHHWVLLYGYTNNFINEKISPFFLNLVGSSKHPLTWLILRLLTNSE